MKTQTQREKSVLGWLPVALLVTGAVGAGVTGTLLWMQSRPANMPPSATASAPMMAAPENAIAGIPAASQTPSNPIHKPASIHKPPPSLTQGMAPAQTALTHGNWYYDHEQWSLAIEHYRAAITQGIDNPDVRTDLGNALRFKGEPQKALEQYQLAQKQNPRHEFSLFNQGALYATDLKQPAKGVAIWREYLQRFPSGRSATHARQLIAQTQNSS